MELYRVYALNYAGPLTSSGAFLMWLQDWETVERRGYFLWCLKGPRETVVVDAGVSPARAEERRLPEYTNPTELLARLDVRADEVQHVVLTHLHWDHVDGISLFPSAAFYVQASEYAFWQRDPLAGRPAFKRFALPEALAHLRALEGTKRLALLDGDQDVLPGVRCLLAPGHSIGLQAVAAHTERGTAILGSDAAHLFRNYREDWPGAIIVDLAAWLRTFDKLRAAASSPDLLFPGHDLRMASDYPRIAEGVTRLA